MVNEDTKPDDVYYALLHALGPQDLDAWGPSEVGPPRYLSALPDEAVPPGAAPPPKATLTVTALARRTARRKKRVA